MHFPNDTHPHLLKTIKCKNHLNYFFPLFLSGMGKCLCQQILRWLSTRIWPIMDTNWETSAKRIRNSFNGKNYPETQHPVCWIGHLTWGLNRIEQKPCQRNFGHFRKTWRKLVFFFFFFQPFIFKIIIFFFFWVISTWGVWRLYINWKKKKKILYYFFLLLNQWYFNFLPYCLPVQRSCSGFTTKIFSKFIQKFLRVKIQLGTPKSLSIKKKS